MIGAQRGAVPGKVGIVTGGGSGHLPVFLGYVGDGLLDSCAVGNVFAGAAHRTTASTAMRAADGGAGVLHLYGNYGGDRMNFDMAAEMLELEGMRSHRSASPTTWPARRRRARASAAAWRASSSSTRSRAPRRPRARTLEEVAALGDARPTTRAARSAWRSRLHRARSRARPTSRIGEDEIEFGMGIHGEPGIWRGALKTADALADEMLGARAAGTALARGDRVAVLVNSLGATPAEELYILYRRVAAVLADQGVTHRAARWSAATPPRWRWPARRSA